MCEKRAVHRSLNITRKSHLISRYPPRTPTKRHALQNKENYSNTIPIRRRATSRWRQHLPPLLLPSAPRLALLPSLLTHSSQQRQSCCCFCFCFLLQGHQRWLSQQCASVLSPFRCWNFEARRGGATMIDAYSLSLLHLTPPLWMRLLILHGNCADPRRGRCSR